MNKAIVGSFRLVHVKGEGYGIETSSDLDRATKHIFVSMLVEQMAHDEGVPQEEYVKMLLDVNGKCPMRFEGDSDE